MYELGGITTLNKPEKSLAVYLESGLFQKLFTPYSSLIKHFCGTCRHVMIIIIKANSGSTSLRSFSSVKLFKKP